jgi:hypothetical protein
MMGTEFTEAETAFFSAGDQLAELAASYLESEEARATWWQRLLGRAANDPWPRLHGDAEVDGYYDAVELVEMAA